MEITPLAEVVLPSGQVRLKGAGKPMQFAGELIAISSSDNGAKRSKLNWTELELYRKTDEIGYVLHIVACSVVYHDVDGCDKGIEVNLGELATRYLDPTCFEPMPEPCALCQPPKLTAPNADTVNVMAETDWHTIYVCATVDDILDNLEQTKGKNAGQLSALAQTLLGRARRVDSVIDDALS